jgi:hypothetical protein
VTQHWLRQAAAEVDFALIHQAAKADGSGLLGPIKTGLVGGQPVHLVLGDHPGGACRTQRGGHYDCSQIQFNSDWRRAVLV